MFGDRARDGNCAGKCNPTFRTSICSIPSNTKIMSYLTFYLRTNTWFFGFLVFAKLPNRCNDYTLHFEVRNVVLTSPSATFIPQL